MAETTTDLRENDVVRYKPDNSWCHEGMAIARYNADGTLALYDTYWGAYEPRLVAPAAFEVLFNLDDYEPAARRTWDRHAVADRQVVPHQHGLQRDLYVRKGSGESQEQIVANARTALAEAEEQVRYAVSSRDGARRVLAEALAASSRLLDGENP